MNEQHLIHIQTISCEKMNINRENVNQSILKSKLKEFIRNVLEEDVGKLKWNFINCFEADEATNNQLSFEMYTLIYKSLVTQESVFVTVECE